MVMKMVDRVIVTLQIENSRTQVDLELPANVPAGQLLPHLLGYLRTQAPGVVRGFDGGELLYRGTALGERDTLAAHGIWDGSILVLRGHTGWPQ